MSTSVNDCYLELAKQLTVAIGHEERRCQYLSLQAKIMMAANDEVAAMPEGNQKEWLLTESQYCYIIRCLGFFNTLSEM